MEGDVYVCLVQNPGVVVTPPISSPLEKAVQNDHMLCRDDFKCDLIYKEESKSSTTFFWSVTVPWIVSVYFIRCDHARFENCSKTVSLIHLV